jgi:hypothetical protein
MVEFGGNAPAGARMSEATSGSCDREHPGFRCAHPGYLLGPDCRG